MNRPTKARLSTLGLVIASALALGCTAGTVEQGDPDINPGSADAAAIPDPGEADAAPEEVASALPKWSLEDIQPNSPMFSQTYGLDVFPEKTVVALLVAGF
jgi:hypothetical protein